MFFIYIVTQNIDLVKVSGNSCKKKGVGSLDVKKNKTASFKINKTPSGNIYEFFCDLSHAIVYSSKPIRADNPEEELMRAWGEGGKEYFIKRLAFPRYPDSDNFKGAFKQQKIDICNDWYRRRQEIIRAIPGSGTEIARIIS